MKSTVERWVDGFYRCVPDIDEDFKRELVNLVPALLSPENLVEKEIGGVKITCRDLLHYYKVSDGVAVQNKVLA